MAEITIDENVLRLLMSYTRHQRKVEAAQQVISYQKKQAESFKKILEREVDRQFGEHLKNNFSHLPEEEQITKWDVVYLPHSQTISVGVLEIGGKIKRVSGLSDKLYGPLPEFLKEITAFGRNYPTNVEIVHVYEIDDIK